MEGYTTINEGGRVRSYISAQYNLFQYRYIMSAVMTKNVKLQYNETEC